MRQSFIMAVNLRIPFAICVAFLGVGCGDGTEKFYPVSGKIMLDGKSLSGVQQGSVSFHGDAAKGNETMHQPIGTINAGGEYELQTIGKPGAPLGWYKVIVSAFANKVEEGPVTPRLLIDKKYYSAETTELRIEVVANPSPGAYDLKVTR